MTRSETGSTGLVLHGPLHLSLTFTLLDCVSLVVLGLAFGQCNLALYFSILPMQVQWHKGVALLLDFTNQASDFVFFK